MVLSAEELLQVEEFASLFFTPEEIKIIMGMAIDVVTIKGSEFDNAYRKGKLMNEASVRRSILDLAKKGSAPAQILAYQMMEKQKLNEISI